jgi:hypothetical protein
MLVATVNCDRSGTPDGCRDELRSGELMGQLELVADALLVYWLTSIGLAMTSLVDSNSIHRCW